MKNKKIESFVECEFISNLKEEVDNFIINTLEPLQFRGILTDSDDIEMLEQILNRCSNIMNKDIRTFAETQKRKKLK